MAGLPAPGRLLGFCSGLQSANCGHSIFFANGHWSGNSNHKAEVPGRQNAYSAITFEITFQKKPLDPYFNRLVPYEGLVGLFFPSLDQSARRWFLENRKCDLLIGLGRLSCTLPTFARCAVSVA
jgi:hypothetical protein